MGKKINCKQQNFFLYLVLVTAIPAKTVPSTLKPELWKGGGLKGLHFHDEPREYL